MVKHKISPKKGKAAGYAASIEQRVNDKTESSTADSSISEPSPVISKKSNLLKTKKDSSESKTRGGGRESKTQKNESGN